MSYLRTVLVIFFLFTVHAQASERGEAFEKCIIQESNDELAQSEGAGVTVKREMILFSADKAFQKCMPIAISEILSLQEVQSIRLRVFEYLDNYWIMSRGT